MDKLKQYLDAHRQDELHPSEIANLLKDLDEKSFDNAVLSIPKELIADVALELPDRYFGDVIESFTAQEIAESVNELESDDQTDFIQELEEIDEEKAKEVFEALDKEYQADILQLENKLNTAREKQRILLQRHIHAHNKKRAEMDIRRMETSDTILRFEQFENRIDRMEAEADLVNYGRNQTLEEEITCLESDEELEKELEDLKAATTRTAEKSQSGKRSTKTPRKQTAETHR